MALFTEWCPTKRFSDEGHGHIPFDDICRRYYWDRETRCWIRKVPRKEELILPPILPPHWHGMFQHDYILAHLKESLR